MPARVVKRGDKWRVVEPDGSLITRGGSAVDGGGHSSREKALAQAAAINAPRSAKGKKRKR